MKKRNEKFRLHGNTKIQVSDSFINRFVVDLNDYFVQTAVIRFFSVSKYSFVKIGDIRGKKLVLKIADEMVRN